MDIVTVGIIGVVILFFICSYMEITDDFKELKKAKPTADKYCELLERLFGLVRDNKVTYMHDHNSKSIIFYLANKEKVVVNYYKDIILSLGIKGIFTSDRYILRQVEPTFHKFMLKKYKKDNIPVSDPEYTEVIDKVLKELPTCKSFPYDFILGDSAGPYTDEKIAKINSKKFKQLF